MRTSGSPYVAVFGLGGTIAMTQASDGGVSPVLSASDLVAAVPGLSDLQAELRSEALDREHRWLGRPAR